MSNQNIIVVHLGKTRKVPFESINFFKADNKYVDLYTNQRVYMTDTSLVKIEKELPEEDFIRIHRNCIVKKSLIESIKKVEGSDNKCEVYLSTGDVLESSRRQTPKIRKFIKSQGVYK